MPFTFQFGGFDPNAFGGGFNPGGGFSGAGDAAQRPARPAVPASPSAMRLPGP